MQIMEGDVIRTLRNHIQHIGHFHTVGNPSRNEIDDSQELNYPTIMRAIAATNYDDYVGQEFSPVKDASISLEMAYRICDVSFGK
jgi:hydroxypyruvate isomerase